MNRRGLVRVEESRGPLVMQLDPWLDRGRMRSERNPGTLLAKEDKEKI